MKDGPVLPLLRAACLLLAACLGPALAFDKPGSEKADARPALVGAAFSSFIWPLLGIIFLPFATLLYVVLYTPGIGLTGWEWFWVVIAGLLDESIVVVLLDP